jgi:hypothetical protein
MPFGPGAPNPSGMPGFHSQYGAKANPGGGNPNATQLNGWVNTVTVCATANDSVMLPPGYDGMEVKVINRGAANLGVFGYMNTAPGDAVTDVIIAAPGTGFVIPTNRMAVFICQTGQGGNTNGITPAQWAVSLLP